MHFQNKTEPKIIQKIISTTKGTVRGEYISA